MAIFQSRKNNKHLIARMESARPRLFRLARSWGCDVDLANDLVQESLLTALKKIDQLRDSAALETWLISILVNNHRMHIRRARRWVDMMQADEPILDTGPDDNLEQQRLTHQVQQAMTLLSDDHRKILTLVDMEEMSYLEVAQVLDIRVGTVMSRVSRARQKLKHLMEKRLGVELHEKTVPPSRLRSVE